MNTFARLCIACAVALAVGALPGCSDLGSEPVIEHLEVRYLSAFIVADMMPVIPPDPDDRISCAVDLIIRNSSAERLSVKFRVMRSDLRGAGDSGRFGTLYFSTAWDGVLEPFQTDTIRLTKQNLSDDFVQPACGASVELAVEIGEAEDLLIRFIATPLTLQCVY